MNIPQDQDKSLQVNYWTQENRKMAILILNEYQQIGSSQKTEWIYDTSSFNMRKMFKVTHKKISYS